MSTTTVIAIYAAALSTLGVGWQIYTWWERQRNRVDVRVFDDEDRDPNEPEHYFNLVAIRVVNRSSHTVNVIGAQLEAGGQVRGFDWVVRDPSWRPGDRTAGLPASILPRHQVDLVRPSEDIAMTLDTNYPVRARVSLGDNSVHVSPRAKIEASF